MKKPDVEDYLQEGIYGSRETKPSERRRFLGTLRERIVLMLTKAQVMQEAGMDELSQQMREHKDSKLLLNGKISYQFRKPYSRLADQYGIHTTSVSDQETDTDVGVLLVVDYPIEKEKIEVEISEPCSPEEETQKDKGLKGILKSLFKTPK
ncbi:YueI family protein [Halobacillus mangrovi]|uniref:YueI family protein n=1 Tax=Halobacillus mangrovi TaxID=402384 RepID=UPI003D99CEB2